PLQTHLGLTFYNATNEQVLYFGKRAKGEFILVAISLDPHGDQETMLEVPLWEFGLGDDGAIDVHELMWGSRFTWRGKMQHWRFHPARPFAICQLTERR